MGLLIADLCTLNEIHLIVFTLKKNVRLTKCEKKTPEGFRILRIHVEQAMERI